MKLLDVAIVAVLVAISLCLCIFALHENIRIVGDDTAYITQGIALANGTTTQYIANNTIMMDKSSTLYGPYAYPWGYPLLLCFAYKIFGFNAIAFKSINIALYAIFIMIFYVFCARRLRRIYAIFATLFFVFSPILTNFVANETMSDALFLLASFVSMILLSKLFTQEDSSDFCDSSDFAKDSSDSAKKTAKKSYCDSAKTSAKDSCDSIKNSIKASKDSSDSTLKAIILAIFAGLFMFLANFTRSAGLVIICALACSHLFLLAKHFYPKFMQMPFIRLFSRLDSKYSYKIHAIPYIICLLGFIIVESTLSSGVSGHIDKFYLDFNRILHNIYGVFIQLGKVFNSDISLILVALVLPLLILGMKQSLKSSNGVFFVIAFLGFYIMSILWLTTDMRFYYPLLPYIVFLVVSGIYHIKSKAIKIASSTMLIIFCVILALWVNIMQSLNYHSENDNDKIYSKDLNAAYTFIKNNTPKDAILLAFRPRAIYLATQRLAYGSNDISLLKEVDFVLLANNSDIDDNVKLLPVESQEFKQSTELIYQNTECRIFRVLK